MTTDWYPGIKAFQEHWRHAPMLQQTFETLEREFAEDNDACIDAAKGFVECACRVLIQELDDPLNPIERWPDSPVRSAHPSFTNWVSAAFRLMAIVERRDDQFSKVVSQHYNLTEALGKFRDLAGTVSHGKEGLGQKLSVHHRRSALLAADALVTFLHESYLEREPDPTRTFEPYERFEASNAIIDGVCVVRWEADVEDGLLHLVVVLPEREEVPLAIEPSRLLFGVDREAYKFVLNACREATSVDDPETESA
jgi:hypothetical protein